MIIIVNIMKNTSRIYNIIKYNSYLNGLPASQGRHDSYIKNNYPNTQSNISSVLNEIYSPYYFMSSLGPCPQGACKDPG